MPTRTPRIPLAGDADGTAAGAGSGVRLPTVVPKPWSEEMSEGSGIGVPASGSRGEGAGIGVAARTALVGPWPPPAVEPPDSGDRVPGLVRPERPTGMSGV